MRSIGEVFTGPFVRGIAEHLDFAEYKARTGMNPSSMANFWQPGAPENFNGLKGRYAFEHPEEREPTDAMTFGTCGHKLLLEPHLFQESVAVWDGGRRAGKAWDQFCEENDGKTLVKQVDMDKLIAMSGTVLKNQAVKELIREGMAEVGIFTEQSGMQCKGRLDWLATHIGTLVDVKFTNSLPRFKNVAAQLVYDIKTACYREWFQRETGKAIDKVVFLVIESEAPFDHAVIELTPMDLEVGFDRACLILRKIAECHERGSWLGFDGGERLLYERPTWDMDDVYAGGEQ